MKKGIKILEKPSEITYIRISTIIKEGGIQQR